MHMASAQGRISAAQGAVDEFRRGLFQSHAAAWRRHAERLRQRAAESGDATTIVSVIVRGGQDGARTEPRLEFIRNVLKDEADQADQTAALYESWVSAGFDSEGLADSARSARSSTEPELVPAGQS